MQLVGCKQKVWTCNWEVKLVNHAIKKNTLEEKSHESDNKNPLNHDSWLPSEP